MSNEQLILQKLEENARELSELKTIILSLTGKTTEKVMKKTADDFKREMLKKQFIRSIK